MPPVPTTRGTAAGLARVMQMSPHGGLHQATLELLVRVTQALHLVSQLENLLVLPVLSIADAERVVTSKQRQRAAAPSRPKVQA